MIQVARQQCKKSKKCALIHVDAKIDCKRDADVKLFLMHKS